MLSFLEVVDVGETVDDVTFVDIVVAVFIEKDKGSSAQVGRQFFISKWLKTTNQ